MKRRDFLKRAAIGAGVFASGMLSGKGRANPSNTPGDTSGSRKQGGDFYKIDAFSHFAPVSYLEYLRSLGGPPSLLQVYGKAWPEFSDVHGLEPRLKMMEDEGIDVSIIFPQPDLEGGLGPVFRTQGKALSAAVFINDYMSKMCTNSPKFKFAALLPLTNKDDMTAEFNRAINLPGVVGVGINTGPLTRPPDDPIHMALYGLAASKKVPVWVHLNRPPIYPDYMTDPLQPTPPFPPNTRMSQTYNWLNFGYLADGSAEMMRIVVADVFKKNPGIKIIVHQRGHLIPLYKDRIKIHFKTFQGLNPPPLGMPRDFDIDYTMEQLKQFYVDAICMGEDTDLLMRSVNFFGADHVMYATDTAFSPNGGRHTAQMTRNSILKLQVSKTDLQNIFAGNIQRLMNAITS
jgi:predicted TIM-barrel fold metal-dependent hydrolase